MAPRHGIDAPISAYFFFHPDFNRRYRNHTGSVPKIRQLRTVTAGGELHPALKNI